MKHTHTHTHTRARAHTRTHTNTHTHTRTHTHWDTHAAAAQHQRVRQHTATQTRVHGVQSHNPTPNGSRYSVLFSSHPSPLALPPRTRSAQRRGKTRACVTSPVSQVHACCPLAEEGRWRLAINKHDKDGELTESVCKLKYGLSSPRFTQTH